MSTLLQIAIVAAALWIGSWLIMIPLGQAPTARTAPRRRRVPARLRDDRTRLRRHPAVPRRAKVALLIATVWVLSPIDLLPEFLPVIGPLDDVVAVVLLLRYAARAIPRDVLLAAWPAEPRLLERLLPTVG